MIYPGACSLTLGHLAPLQVIESCQRAGLAGIEWWGKKHVPHGEIAVAKQVGNLTRNAGLSVSSYGSYYRAGISENEGLAFSAVCETALALGAPMIRVWAGNQGTAESDAAYFQAVVDDLSRIADMATESGVAITVEYHGGTLTDDPATVSELSARIAHPAVFFSWQPPIGLSATECLSGLEAVLPRLGTIHVFHWTAGKEPGRQTIRHPLVDGIEF